MSKQLQPDTEALDAYFASFEPIDVRPKAPSKLPAASSRVSSGTRSTRRLCLEQLEAREVPSATVFGDASNNWDSALVWTQPSDNTETVDVRLVPHSSGVVADHANVNFGEGIAVNVSTGTGAGMVLNSDALTSLDDAYNYLHGTAANPLGTDHMNFNFVSRLTGAIAIRLKQLDLGHIAHGNVLIDGSNGRTTVPIPSNGVIPWNPAVGIDSIMVINAHNQGELNPLGLSGIDVQMYLPNTPTDLGALTNQVTALTQQVRDAQTALTAVEAATPPPPALNALPWPEGVNASAKILGKLNVHPGQNLYAMHFSPDGNRFVTAGQDKVAKIWNASTGALERTLTGNNSLVMDAVWSADGQSVWTTGYDKHVRQYSAANGGLLWDSGDLGGLALSAAMSSDGANLTVSMHGMAPKVINTQTKAVNALGSGLIWTGNMTAMSDANVLMYVNTNAYRSGNYALIVNPATRQTVWQSNIMGGQLNAIAATPDGQWIVAGDDAGGLTVWKRSTNQQMFTLPNQGGVITSMVTSGDGNQLFVGSGSKIVAFDLRPLATNQAPTLLHTYADIGNGPRGMSVQGKNVTAVSGDNSASRLVAVDRSGLSGYEDMSARLVAAQTLVSTLTAQLNTAQHQLDVLSAQEQQRNAVVAVLTQAGAMAEAEATVANLAERMDALETWTLAGKADRLHALADRGAALTQATSDVRDALAMIESRFSSDPTFYGALKEQAQQHAATLFGLSEQWSVLQADFNAIDWARLSPKTLERLFPGSAEQPQTTFSVVQTQGNAVTLAIGGTGPMSAVLEHGDAYLGSRTINTITNPPAFQTVTLMLDRNTASGPQTVNLLSATGTVLSTMTLNWNKDTNTLSVADNANLFTPQGMAKDLGTMTYQQLFEQAETEELSQMTQTQNAITQQGLVSQINSAIITNNLISNNNGVMTSFVELQNEQLLYLICNTMGAPYDFAVSEAKFTASFYSAFPQWKEENRQQTMASYHLSSPNFDYYREAERNGWHQKIYPFNMTAASIIAASMDAALAIRRGQSPTSYIAQANNLSSGGGPLASMGIQLPTANAALQACEAYLEQHASEFLEFQAPYVEQIQQLWQSYSTGNSWAGGGAGSLSANQQAEANLTHQHNLAVILASTGTGSAIDRAAGYVLANPVAQVAVTQLPSAQQAAINAAVVVLKNGGATAKDGGLGKLAEAKDKLALGIGDLSVQKIEMDIGGSESAPASMVQRRWDPTTLGQIENQALHLYQESQGVPGFAAEIATLQLTAIGRVFLGISQQAVLATSDVRLQELAHMVYAATGISESKALLALRSAPDANGRPSALRQLFSKDSTLESAFHVPPIPGTGVTAISANVVDGVVRFRFNYATPSSEYYSGNIYLLNAQGVQISTVALGPVDFKNTMWVDVPLDRISSILKDAYGTSISSINLRFKIALWQQDGHGPGLAGVNTTTTPISLNLANAVSDLSTSTDAYQHQKENMILNSLILPVASTGWGSGIGSEKHTGKNLFALDLSEGGDTGQAIRMAATGYIDSVDLDDGRVIVRHQTASGEIWFTQYEHMTHILESITGHTYISKKDASTLSVAEQAQATLDRAAAQTAINAYIIAAKAATTPLQQGVDFAKVGNEGTYTSGSHVHLSIYDAEGHAINAYHWADTQQAGMTHSASVGGNPESLVFTWNNGANTLVNAAQHIAMVRVDKHNPDGTLAMVNGEPVAENLAYAWEAGKTVDQMKKIIYVTVHDVRKSDGSIGDAQLWIEESTQSNAVKYWNSEQGLFLDIPR